MRRSVITVAAVAGAGVLGIGGIAVATTVGEERGDVADTAARSDADSGAEAPSDDDAPHDLPGLPEGLPEHLPDDLSELRDLADDPEVAALADSVQPMIDAATEGLELLDLSPQELLTELHGGATLAELATEQGVDPDELVQLGLEPVESELADAVTEGEVSQDEADTARAELETLLRTVVEEGPAAGLQGIHGAPTDG